MTLKEWRIEKGLSVKGLARLLEVKNVTIARNEEYDKPSEFLAERLINHFGLDVLVIDDIPYDISKIDFDLDDAVIIMNRLIQTVNVYKKYAQNIETMMEVFKEIMIKEKIVMPERIYSPPVKVESEFLDI